MRNADDGIDLESSGARLIRYLADDNGDLGIDALPGTSGAGNLAVRFQAQGDVRDAQSAVRGSCPGLGARCAQAAPGGGFDDARPTEGVGPTPGTCT